MSGDLSPKAPKAQAFEQMLREEAGLPVTLWDDVSQPPKRTDISTLPGSPGRIIRKLSIRWLLC